MELAIDMASLIDEIKVLGMSERANNRERADNRRTVLFEVAYKLYVKQVYTLSLRLLANVRDAEEVTVRVFATFSRELPRKWDESRVLARLRELAIDEALRCLWGCIRERLEGQAAVGNCPPAMSIDADLGEEKVMPTVALRPLDLATLEALTNRLPDNLRVAFVLRDLEGLDNQTVARHMRVDEPAVRKLINTARLALRRLWLSQTKESV